ncbi:unnamed protein product [Agarophyton chilense]
MSASMSDCFMGTSALSPPLVTPKFMDAFGPPPPPSPPPPPDVLTRPTPIAARPELITLAPPDAPYTLTRVWFTASSAFAGFTVFIPFEHPTPTPPQLPPLLQLPPLPQLPPPPPPPPGPMRPLILPSSIPAVKALTSRLLCCPTP